MPNPRTRSRQPNDLRPIRHYVRVTAAQERALQARAKAAGVTVARLMAEGGTGWDSQQLSALRTDLEDVRWWLARINPNVNQIALQLNCDEVPELAEVAALPGEVRGALDRLDAALERLG